jgi:hypothetical protein
LVAPATSRDAQGAQNAELAGTQTGAPLICVRDRPKLTP